MKSDKASEVICDCKVPTKLKGKFYRTAIIYGSECWALKGQLERKVRVAKMRMLKWMCGHTNTEWRYTREDWCSIHWGKWWQKIG